MIQIATQEDVSKFCDYTKDSNKIHNSELMKEQGRKAAVPAMYLMFRDISAIENPHEAKTISLEMDNVCSVEDSLTLLYQSRPKLYQILGYENVKFGSKGIEGDLVYELDLDSAYQENSSDLNEKEHSMDIKICEKAVNGLENLFKPKNNLGRTLSLMTSASGIMLAAIKDPVNEHEKEIGDLMKKHNLLPVYTGFTYTFPNGLKPTNSTMANYSVTFRDNTPKNVKAKQKDIFTKVICETDDIKFNAYFNFKLVPEKVIIRKGLEKLE